MHRKLLLMAFEKVRGELNDEGDKSPSINKCAKELSAIISKDFAYGSRILRILYKRANENEEDTFIMPKAEVVPILVKYLGYKNYEEFVLMNKGEEQKKIDDGGVLLISATDGTAQKKVSETVIGSKKNFKLTKGIVFAGISIIAITVSVYFLIDRPKWMVWNGNRYEMQSFDAELEKNGVLSLYDENSYEYLIKITPTCETEFFNGDGSVRIWYGKNSKKEYEFFTSLGKHPETGKTLKPITEYMIRKYICP
jgi:hypothetical protein